MRASLRIDPRQGAHALFSRALSILGAGAGDKKEMQSPAGILLHNWSDDQGTLSPGSQAGPSPRRPRRAALHRGHQPSTAHSLPDLVAPQLLLPSQAHLPSLGWLGNNPRVPGSDVEIPCPRVEVFPQRLHQQEGRWKARSLTHQPPLCPAPWGSWEGPSIISDD